MSYNKEFNVYGYGNGYGYSKGFGCEVINKYRHPQPEPKRRLFLDTVMVEDFTVNRLKEGCVDNCCAPVAAGVSIKNSVLILSAQTECLDRDTYYTFDLARDIDFSAKQVFIKAKPCGFVRGAIEYEKTEITVPYCDFPCLKITAENLPKFYRAKYDDNDDCCDNDHKEEAFIEVDLDLRGNIATAAYFARNHVGKYEPDNDKYVLYLNNAGRLTLCRDVCSTKKFGDFH